MADEVQTVAPIERAKADLERSSAVRNNVVTHLTTGGIPDDKDRLRILLAAVDGMDRTALRVMALDGEQESRDLDRQAIELAERISTNASLAPEVRNYDDETSDETIITGTATLVTEDIPEVDVNLLGNHTFMESETTSGATSTDWEEVETTVSESIEKELEQISGS